MNYILEIKAFYDWLEVNQLSTSAIALWHALMHIANKTGWQDTFTVAIVVLSTKTGLEKKAIYNARVALQNKGLISFQTRKGKQSTIYQIHSLVALKETQAGTQTGTQAGTQTGTQTGTINKQNETKQNETKKKDTNVSQEKRFVEHEKLNATILDFIEFRKNIKNPMTERAIKLLINKLNDLAANDEQKQIAMLEQSILAGWKSVYPLGDNKQNSTQKTVQATTVKQNRFVNYEQRKWDFKELENLERERLAQEADNREKPKDERYMALLAKIEGSSNT